MFGYAATDLNGDGNTDLLDVIYMDYGIANYLFSMYPVAATLPTVSTNAISNITYTTASSGGIISSNGGAVVTARGVCWSTSPNATVLLSTKTVDGIGSGSFSSNITGLAASTAYYVRAYATNSAGTAYGSQIVFTTTAPVLPTLSTTALSNISYTTASSGGSISSDGGALVTIRGVCWSTSINPTTALSTKTIDGSGIGSFSSNIIGLVAGTAYYVRAYATNSVGTTYGNQVVFTTLAIGQSYQGGIIAYLLQPSDPGYNANVPRGLIAAPSDQSIGIPWYIGSSIVTGATGIALGTGSNNTNTIVSVQGNGNYAAQLCYDLVLNGFSDWYLPSKDELNKIYLNKTAIGGFSNSYYWCSSEQVNYPIYYTWMQYFGNGSQITVASGNYTSAHVRAIRSFNFINLSTTSVSGITSTTAGSGGSISSDGGTAVTARGVCWSTSSNPTVTLSTKTTDGSGTGSFSSSITGLSPGNNYYVRAYATNSVGTDYGNEVVFNTLVLTIGMSFQGGILAYILQPGDPGYDANVPHGLIAAPSDQSTGIKWYNGSNVITGATATALGAGNANTNTIVSVQGNGVYATQLCYDLVLNGFSDWYLPSKDELNKLYLNQIAIGGFAAAYYWSSSEYNNNIAWRQYFSNGLQSYAGKLGTYYVRAIRSF
jgi:DUF971 family protein